MEYILTYFSNAGFVPHGHCYQWREELLGLHVGSDLLIAIAYCSIPFTLIYLVKKRKDLPFDWIFGLFSAFIFACGIAHLLSIWTVWFPDYWTSGLVKFVTASLSMITAIALVPLVPRILSLPSPTELEFANEELKKQVEARLEAEKELLLYKQKLENRIENRTVQLRQTNEVLRAIVDQLEAKMNELDIFKKVFEYSPLGEMILEVKDDSKENSFYILNSNLSAYRLVGIPDESTGKPLQEVLPENIKTKLIGMVSDSTNDVSINIKKSELTFLDSKTEKLQTCKTLIFPVQANILAIIFEDFTEHKQMENLLRDKEAKVRAILDTAADGIISIDKRGLIEAFNASAEKLFGYTVEDVLGKNVNILMPSPYDKEHDGYIAKYLKTLTPKIAGTNREVMGKRRDGSLFPMYISIGEARIGEDIFFTGIMRDLTEAKEMEKSLFEAKEKAENADRVKSDFLATMSHELRTPLNSIIGYSQILQNDTSLSEANLRAIQTIYESGEHLLLLISDILHLSKIEFNTLELNLKPFVLDSIFDNVISMIQLRMKAKNLEFASSITKSSCEVLGDQQRIHQIILNLLSNAIKFTEKGKISLTGIIRKSEIPNHCNIYIEVLDTGIGISKEKLDQIFIPFKQYGSTQSKSEGVGLGLSICQKLAKMMASEIKVESEPGKGSKFYFTLTLQHVQKNPRILTDSPKERTIPSIQKSQPRNTVLKVLLVDDNQRNRELLTDILNPSCFVIFQASNGKEAYQLAVENRPDLILLDFILPDVNGFEFLQKLLQCKDMFSFRLLVISASVSRELPQQCIEMGADGFLTKPIHIEKLLAKIANFFNFLPFPSKQSFAQETKAIANAGANLSYESLNKIQDLASGGELSGLEKLLAELKNNKKHPMSFLQDLEEKLDNFDFTGMIALVDAYRVNHGS
ncbi:MAG: PAS domain S-box protein [Spirochaetota bacterium]